MERDLCATLNTLAMRLLAKADAPPPAGKGKAAAGGSRAAAAAAADDDEEDEEEARERAAKRARRSKGGAGEPASREELTARAQHLLEQSFRVAEKGIGGELGAGPGAAPAVGAGGCSLTCVGTCSSRAPIAHCHPLCRPALPRPALLQPST